jgi:glycosyltransferase involved in cell wall biosynthesis
VAKVLSISSWYPNKKNSLDGNFVQNLLISLAESHQITNFFVNSNTNNQEEIIRIKNPHHPNLLEIYHYFPYHKWKLIRLYRTIMAFLKSFSFAKDAEIIHVHVFYPAFFIGLILKLIYKKPLVVTEHSSSFVSKFDSIYYRLIFQLFHHFVDFFVPVSQNIVNFYLKNGVKNIKIHVIPNSINDKIFTYRKAEKFTEFTLLHVSNFKEYHKNIRGILQGFEQFTTQNPLSKVQLLLVGDGDLHKLQEMLLDFPRIKSNVTLLGKQSPEDLSHLYNKSHGFVLFSIMENQPCVISEALMCGLPVISSAVGDIENHINEENGFLVESKDVAALSQAFMKLFMHHQDYNAIQISESAKKRYSFATIRSRYNEIYQLALNQHK